MLTLLRDLHSVGLQVVLCETAVLNSQTTMHQAELLYYRCDEHQGRRMLKACPSRQPPFLPAPDLAQGTRATSPDAE